MGICLCRRSCALACRELTRGLHSSVTCSTPAPMPCTACHAEVLPLALHAPAAADCRGGGGLRGASLCVAGAITLEVPLALLLLAPSSGSCFPTSPGMRERLLSSLPVAGAHPSTLPLSSLSPHPGLPLSHAGQDGERRICAAPHPGAVCLAAPAPGGAHAAAGGAHHLHLVSYLVDLACRVRHVRPCLAACVLSQCACWELPCPPCGSHPVCFPPPAGTTSGEHDWMDAKAARRLVGAIASHRKPQFSGDLKVLVTPDAGLCCWPAVLACACQQQDMHPCDCCWLVPSRHAHTCSSQFACPALPDTPTGHYPAIDQPGEWAGGGGLLLQSLPASCSCCTYFVHP